MYFWKIDKLVDDFRNDNVSELEKFKYLVTGSIAYYLLTDPYTLSFSALDSYGQLDAVNLLIGVVVVFFGTFYCFKLNAKGDNKDFIPRMICLGLPVVIRVLFFSVFFMFSVYFIKEIVSPFPEDLVATTSWLDVFIFQSILAFSFWYTGRYIKKVAAL